MLPPPHLSESPGQGVHLDSPCLMITPWGRVPGPAARGVLMRQAIQLQYSQAVQLQVLQVGVRGQYT
jgi:hypothetical protein